MNNINKIISGLMLAALMLAGCTNQEQVFEDFKTKAVYFPLQYPIRTIVLGEDRIDNTIDKEKAFNIGVSVSGMYENTSDRKVKFELAPSIFPDVSLGLDTIYGKDPQNIERKLLILPETHYSMTPTGSVTVPKGSMSGLIRVNLTDAFFEDPKSYTTNYVIPLRITEVSDNFDILKGKKVDGIILDAVTKLPIAPRWYVNSDWATGFTPKDYTLFAVKFINVWHGTFFQRGVQKKEGVVDKIFHREDISSDQTAKLETVGLKKATYNRMGEKLTTATANYKSLLTFSDDVNGEGNITVSTAPGTTYTITGTGKYYKSSTATGKANGWIFDPITGVKKGALTVTLDFTVTGLAGATLHQFTDTLVFRSNDVKYEEFAPVAKVKKII